MPLIRFFAFRHRNNRSHLCKQLVVFWLTFFSLLTTLVAAETTNPGQKRTLQTIEEAESAIAQNKDLYTLLNLSFFGSYGGVDKLIDKLYREMCQHDVIAIRAVNGWLQDHAYHERALKIISVLEQRMQHHPDSVSDKISKSWSYRNLVTHLSMLDCLFSKASRLSFSSKWVDLIEAEYIFNALKGYRDATERLEQLLMRETDTAASLLPVDNTPKTLHENLNTYHFFGLKLDDTLEDVLFHLPELTPTELTAADKLLASSRLQRKSRAFGQNTTLLDVWISSQDYGGRVYKILFTLQTLGLEAIHIERLLAKVFDKFGLPDIDMTLEEAPFNPALLGQRLQRAIQQPATFCWGECQRFVFSDTFTPGRRLLLTYRPSAYELTLNLFITGLMPLSLPATHTPLLNHNASEDAWLHFLPDQENTKKLDF